MAANDFLGINNPNAQAPVPSTPKKANTVTLPPAQVYDNPANNGKFWRGTDGLVYVQGANGTNTAGKWDDNSSSYWMGQGYAMGATPKPAGKTADELAYDKFLAAQAAANAPKYEDTTEARRGTQSSLDSLDTILRNKLAEAQAEYDSLKAEYGAEDARNAEKFNERTSANEGNRETQQQAALLAAANGGRGLNSVLASIGALGGTGRTLANRAVANEANLDIGEANRTFKTNAENLTGTYGELKMQEEKRKREAENTFEKTKQAREYDALSKRQQLHKDMADLWSRAGNSGEFSKSMGNARGLDADIMRNSNPTGVASYSRDALNYSAPDLEGYLAGANDMSVNTSAGGGLPLNGAIYTSTKKREKLV
jgi:hypothetical protein